MNNQEREQLAQWLEQLIDDRLAPDAMADLERLLMDDPEARELYLDLTRQHAQLHLDRVRVPSVPDGEFSELAVRRAGDRKLSHWVALAIAAAACLIAAVWLGRGPVTPSSPTLAELTSAEDASWGPSTLPTTVGSDLGPGRLQLQRGLATVRFRSGAEVTLQGPAGLQIEDVLRGTLLDGTAVVEVPESAHGFTLDTPTASVIDYGTMFAVTVDSARNTSTVDVLEGEVEVKHASTDAAQRLQEKQTTVVTESRMDEPAESSDEPALTGPARPEPAEGNVIRITTATGRGRDATVIQSDVYNHANPYMVFVKNCDDEYRRKGYLAFDLASLAGQPIESARLVLTLQPSGFGYASLAADSTFSVYGLTDEGLDAWTASDLRWESAPANRDAGDAVDTRLARKLGEFHVPRGRQTGQVSIEGADLRDFLNTDTNGIVTLIIVRDTTDLRVPGLVHAFANHMHPTAAPPVLELELSNSHYRALHIQ